MSQTREEFLEKYEIILISQTYLKDIVMNLVTFPGDLFNTLKCYLCGKYLSVGPVISITNDGKPYKCGRCKDIPSEKIIRNLCYEKVAAFLTFPCSYEKCDVKLVWEQVEKHEKICQYRIIQCVHNGCDIPINIADFETHFKSHSEKRVFSDNIENFVIKKYCSTVFLLKKVMLQFIIVIRYCIGTLHAGVFSLQPLKQSTFFELKISSNILHSPLVSYKGEVNVYDELVHCVNCMRKKCHLCYHKYSENYDNSGLNIITLPLKINFEALEKLLLSPAKMMYSVNILPQFNNVNNKISDTSSESGISEKTEIHQDRFSFAEPDGIEQDIQYLFKSNMDQFNNV